MADAARKPDLSAILAEARAFHEGFATLMMATVSASGDPVASYAPYVVDGEGCFHVYISELAAHTANLAANGKASVLFIEDEGQASQLFARKRLTCTCLAEEIARDTPVFAEVMRRFDHRHGGIMGVLRGLRDFHLFRLRPTRATYVRGFGEAFELDGTLLDIRHMNDRGHPGGGRQGV